MKFIEAATNEDRVDELFTAIEHLCRFFNRPINPVHQRLATSYTQYEGFRMHLENDNEQLGAALVERIWNSSMPNNMLGFLQFIRNALHLGENETGWYDQADSYRAVTLLSEFVGADVDRMMKRSKAFTSAVILYLLKLYPSLEADVTSIRIDARIEFNESSANSVSPTTENSKYSD